MKYAFATLLVLNFLTEILAAASLIGGSEGVIAAGKGNMWSMHYGFAALAIASVSLWSWRSRSDLRVVTVVLGILVTFHTGLLVSLVLAGDQQAGVIMHAVLAMLSIFLFLQRSKWCAA